MPYLLIYTYANTYNVRVNSMPYFKHQVGCKHSIIKAAISFMMIRCCAKHRILHILHHQRSTCYHRNQSTQKYEDRTYTILQSTLRSYSNENLLLILFSLIEDFLMNTIINTLYQSYSYFMKSWSNK